MSDTILQSKSLIASQVSKRTIILPEGFGKYSKAYAATNENIDGYMKNLEFRGDDTVFSVLGSGDHAFNAILYGAKEVDTFDSCPLTEYFALGIKRSAILAFSYSEFLRFSRRIADPNTSLGELTCYIEYLYPYMERKHQIYWETIVDYNYDLQKWHLKKINLMQMLLVNTKGLFFNTFKNSYLRSEEDYNRLRSRIGQANITFKETNVFDYANDNKRKYDFIFLSNIPDYFYSVLGKGYQYKELDPFKSNLSSTLSYDGVMCFSYLISCYRNGKLQDKLLCSSNVGKESLGNDELCLIPHIKDNDEVVNEKDGVILVRR